MRGQRTFRIHVKNIDQLQGVVEFIASVFGNQDQGGDVVLPGAFQKAIDSQPRPPKYVPNHDWSVEKRLGKVLDWKEIAEGLWIRAKHNLEKQISKDVLSDFAFDPEGQEFSFSYEIADGGAELKDGIRYISEVKEVYDVGPVGVGMNRETSLVSVKAWVYIPGSFEERQDVVFRAVARWAAGMPGWPNLEATYLDRVVFSMYDWESDAMRYWEATYQMASDGTVTMDDPVEVAIEAQVVAKLMGRSARSKEGRRNSAADLELVQQVHDAATSLGADCAGNDGKSKVKPEDPPKGGKGEEPDEAHVAELLLAYPE